MRKDMFKVIVERPRRDPKTHKKGRQKSFEDMPQKESMRKKYDWNWSRKELNENLKPLVRFLKSKVGKKWDNVYSEICEHLKLDSAVQKHVRDHVFDYVRLNIRKEDKKIFYISKYYGKWTELYNDDLYVDPDNGILKLYKVKRKKRTRQEYLTDAYKGISSRKSKTIVEDGEVFKLFKDKVTNDFTIKHKATKKHAESDFLDNKGSFGSGLEYLKLSIEKILTNTKIKHEYFDAYLSLIDKAQKEITPRPQRFKVGDLVKFKRYASEEFQEGVINLIQYTKDNSQYIAHITVGTKNIRVMSGLSLCSINKI